MSSLLVYTQLFIQTVLASSRKYHFPWLCDSLLSEFGRGCEKLNWIKNAAGFNPPCSRAANISNTKVRKTFYFGINVSRYEFAVRICFKPDSLSSSP